ncbi:probable disease resistance protein RPP1 [Magnolia sinica]|uniref:probable disease resistance protein RPP1 n=1 Tax=Magnolia sinica TaxID=86752 RepID=UPI00265A7F06|nr:probable disease resistance protein RPP1 [Magnolia sinica]
MEGSSGGQCHVDMNSHVMEVIDSQMFLEKYNFHRKESCQWISLSNNQVETLPFCSPDCPLLSTLLLNNNDHLQEISDDFSTSISSLPSSMSCLCELRLLKLRSCCKLDALPAFLEDMQKLKILDLHQTPPTKMVEVSFHNMQSLRRLNISGACDFSQLSLKGCRSLLTLVIPDKLSKHEALDLSGTKMEEHPHEIFNLTTMRCLDLLRMEHLKKID